MARRVKVGDWVEVRPEPEILRTLDENGQLDGMPFMPEMLPFCGLRFQVLKRAHKTCDSIARQSRRLERAVHLNIRCSGEAHGGCQAGCLLFWKEDWLRRVESGALTAPIAPEAVPDQSQPAFGRKELFAATLRRQGESFRYVCQVTQIRPASTLLPWWDLRQYFEDVLSGNVGMWSMICGCASGVCIAASRAVTGFERPVRWIFDRFHSLWNGHPFPYRMGKIPRGQRTPVSTLGLQCGEMVRVRSLPEIEQTLDTAGKNRGLYFDPEMVPYANGKFRVLKRVNRIINEKTGRMLEFKTPGILLDSVACQGRYSTCRMFCPKNSYAIWHEAWLDREHSNEDPPE